MLHHISICNKNQFYEILLISELKHLSSVTCVAKEEHSRAKGAKVYCTVLYLIISGKKGLLPLLAGLDPHSTKKKKIFDQ
jgi:hypothetical protein